MKTKSSNIRFIFFISLLLIISIDIALIITEFFQDSNNIKSYLIQLSVNLYIMLGTLFTDYNSFKISKLVEDISFKQYITSFYENYRYNTKNNEYYSNNAKYNYENIVLPYIQSMIDIIQKSLDLFFCLIVITILLINNILFGLICIIILLFIFATFFLITNNQKIYNKKVIEDLSLLQNKLLECYFGIRDIIIYKKQNLFLNKINLLMKKMMNSFYKTLFFSGANICIFNSLDIFLPTLLLIILRNSKTLESFNIICIIFYFLHAVKKISNITIILQNYIVFKKKYLELCNNKKNINIFNFYLKDISLSTTYSGNIQINNNKLIIENYCSNISGLKIASLTLIPNTKIILSAPIGTGKSVLFKDIFESIDKKRILYIPPNVEIFSGSVMDNIFFESNHLITDFENNILLKVGFTKNFLTRHVDNNELSGGEKKRIAFLRFYFHKKNINILDEVLSEVEEGILKVMTELIKDCSETIIIATHNEFVKENFPLIELKK